MFILAFIAIFWDEITVSSSTFTLFAKEYFKIKIPYASNMISFLISLGVVINALIFSLILGNRINLIVEEFKEFISMIFPDNTEGLVARDDDFEAEVNEISSK